MTKVELFEDIRKQNFVQGQSIRGIAQELQVHRRTERQALESAVPPARSRPSRYLCELMFLTILHTNTGRSVMFILPISLRILFTMISGWKTFSL